MSVNKLTASEQEFLNRVSGLISDNISNERFGVSELAYELSMSRSNLLRKIKKITGLSVSVFIRNRRLEESLELLKGGGHTVSEVSYEVGFGSVSYYVKCFHEYYGYPPGEAGQHGFKVPDTQSGKKSRLTGRVIIYFAIFLVLCSTVLILTLPFSGKETAEPEKSIAVLPFINDSNDSTNLYFVNGLMESVLNNLQLIEDLRVVSRTSAEKYRNRDKTVTEIGKELGVSYIIEGSGQKIENEILLNIQLIETSGDRHIWAEQFRREASDIFSLQSEVARQIASYVKVTISPDEEARINKVPTKSLLAWDYFLKGLERFHSDSFAGYKEAIELFKKAIELDDEFARAYADVSISYSFLEMYRADLDYSDLKLFYADRALQYDPELEQSLVAKAMYFLSSSEPHSALPYMEKAHAGYPNSAIVLNLLSEYYANVAPDAKMYLEYTLKGLNIDFAKSDSTDASFLYLHIGNSFMQTGLPDQAKTYLLRSLDYMPDNLFSQYVLAYIEYAINGDLDKTRSMIEEVLTRDSTRYDILQELGKVCYYLRDYKSAEYYYSRYLSITEALGIDIYRGENAKIAYVFGQTGRSDESERLMSKYFDYAENDQTIYHNLSLSAYYSFYGDVEKSLEFFSRFAESTGYSYLVIPLIEIDPLLDNLREHPEFAPLFQEFKDNFEKYRQEVRRDLEKKGLLTGIPAQ